MTDVWEAGEVVSGRFRLVRHLGRGGMGTVWEAQHLALRTPVALKFLALELVQNEEGARRLLREAQAAASLRSTHVVTVFDCGAHRGVPFLVMELLRGETLAARLRRQWRLSWSDALQVLPPVARVMNRAHQAGIVHRDLKPANLFIASEDDSPIVKVLDFGVAKALFDEGVVDAGLRTATGALLGTPEYMSPEQARGARNVDWRADIWSFGVIAYECLTGKSPFRAAGPGAVLLKVCSERMPVPSADGMVPEGFDAWFARAVDRDRARRYQSMQEAGVDLEGLLRRAIQRGGEDTSRPIAATLQLVPADTPVQMVASTASKPPRPRRSPRALAAGAIVLVAAGVVALGLLVPRWPLRMVPGPIHTAVLGATARLTPALKELPVQPLSSASSVIPKDSHPPRTSDEARVPSSPGNKPGRPPRATSASGGGALAVLPEPEVMPASEPAPSSDPVSPAGSAGPLQEMVGY